MQTNEACWGVMWCNATLAVPNFTAGACHCASVRAGEQGFHSQLLRAFGSRWPLERSHPAYRQLSNCDGKQRGNQYCMLEHGLHHLLPSQGESQAPAAKASWLEFGVATGYSANLTCSAMAASGRPDVRLHGFDTFTGLPTEWRHSPRKAPMPQGTFTQHGNVPRGVPCASFHRGLINETLPAWAASHAHTNVLGVSIDVDLYSGALSALETLHAARLLRSGALVHFHDLVLPYGRGDSNVHNPEAFAAFPPHERALLRRRARTVVPESEQVSDEQRALYAFLAAASESTPTWWLVPSFDPIFVIPALFVVA